MKAVLLSNILYYKKNDTDSKVGDDGNGRNLADLDD